MEDEREAAMMLVARLIDDCPADEFVIESDSLVTAVNGCSNKTNNTSKLQ